MRTAILLLTALLVALLAGCSEPSSHDKKTTGRHLVETISVQRQAIAIERERTGTLRANQEIHIYTQEAGQITALPFYEGDPVDKGQLVAQLDDRLLQAQLQRTRALRRKAEKDLQRIRGLAKRGLAAEIELTRVETELAVTRADEQLLATRLDYTQLRSPISGLVSQRLSEAGNIAERYSHLLTISDQSSLISELTVSELLINKLQLGDEVAMSIDALSGIQKPAERPLRGKITRIYPTLDPLTRTGTVEIVLKPVPPGALPGQLARVRLRTQEADRLLIPFVALRRSSQGEYVYIVDGDSRAQVVPVMSGLKIDARIEILDGLTAGQQVITRGFTNLRSNTQVTVVSAVNAQGSAATPRLPAITRASGEG